MLTTTILITGGLVLGGARILLRRRQARTPVWLTQSDGSRLKSYALIVEQDEMAETRLAQEVDTEYALSTVSLGLSVAGVLVAAPIALLGLPINIYNLAAIVEQAYNGLSRQRRIAQLAAVSVALTVFTLSNQSLIVSCIQWLYFAYRRAAFKLGRLAGPVVVTAH